MLHFKNKTLTLASIITVVLSTNSHADVYFKNNFEPNISNCNDTMTSVPRQEQPNNYFLEVGDAFGNFSSGNTGNFSMNKNEYISLFFVAPEASAEQQRGRIIFIAPPLIYGNSDATTVTISECPGDFSTHLDQASCKITHDDDGTFHWSLDTSKNPVGCLLIPDKVYYLNFLHSTDDANDYQQSSCINDIDSSCGIFFSEFL